MKNKTTTPDRNYKKNPLLYCRLQPSEAIGPRYLLTSVFRVARPALRNATRRVGHGRLVPSVSSRLLSTKRARLLPRPLLERFDQRTPSNGGTGAARKSRKEKTKPAAETPCSSAHSPCCATFCYSCVRNTISTQHCSGLLKILRQIITRHFQCLCDDTELI